jgi:thiamine-phosphate pyrophosphorylase
MHDRCLLYYITDRSQFLGDDVDRRSALLAKVAEAARAGVDYIQLRERDLSARELETLARDAQTAVRNNAPLRTENRELRTGVELRTGPELGTRILINSRTDVALAAGVDGVHLRADDLTPDEVRQMLKDSARSPAANHFLVAASCHSNEDVRRAESEAVDFAVFAPVFGKINAPGTQPTGVAALHDACRTKISVFALGGVSMENAESCLNAGAAGIAGIRLFQENKIEDVVRALRAL